MLLPPEKIGQSNAPAKLRRERLPHDIESLEHRRRAPAASAGSWGAPVNFHTTAIMGFHALTLGMTDGLQIEEHQALGGCQEILP